MNKFMLADLFEVGTESHFLGKSLHPHPTKTAFDNLLFYKQQRDFLLEESGLLFSPLLSQAERVFQVAVGSLLTTRRWGPFNLPLVEGDVNSGTHSRR
jgi:hypothetical protein